MKKRPELAHFFAENNVTTAIFCPIYCSTLLRVLVGKETTSCQWQQDQLNSQTKYWYFMDTSAYPLGQFCPSYLRAPFTEPTPSPPFWLYTIRMDWKDDFEYFSSMFAHKKRSSKRAWEMGKVWSAVDRAVTSDTGRPQFKSNHWFLLWLWDS